MPSDASLTNDRIIESFTPARACLLGSVMTSGAVGQPLSPMTFQQIRASRSLKLVRRLDLVSSQIRSAILKKSILPKVEIYTSSGVITLTNALIVQVRPYRPKHGTGRHGGSSGTGRNELEEIDWWFEWVTYTNDQGGKSGQDGWNATT